MDDPSYPTDDLDWPGEHSRAWFEGHTLTSRHIPPLGDLVTRKRAEGLRVSVGLPALNEGTTIGPILKIIREELMGPDGLVDDLAVLDGGSSDDTGEVARAAGARFLPTRDILPELPAWPGKGEALWRSLHELRGDIIVWVDSDIRYFTPAFVVNLVAPFLLNPDLAFVKGFYERPLERNGEMMPREGGRVTELLARPLLSALFPELSGFIQPLSGEYAGRREALMGVPFFTGYAVEVGLLIDLANSVGLDAMAQVDLAERVHRNRPLGELSPMATAIARAIFKRAEQRGRITSEIEIEGTPFLYPGPDATLQAREIDDPERPPMRLLSSYLTALRAGLDTDAADIP